FPHEAKKAQLEPTLDQFLRERYESWLTTGKKSGWQSVARIRLRFAFLLKRQLSAIDAWSIERWRTERLRAGITKQTINKDLCLLKAALNRAVEWDILPDNPLRKVKAYRVENCFRTRFLSLDEEKRLRLALLAREFEIRGGRD